MSVCVASVAGRDIPMCFMSCDRRNSLASLVADDVHFLWQAQHFKRVHLHFAWQAQHFWRVVLRAFANRNARAASRSETRKLCGRHGYRESVFCAARAAVGAVGTDPSCVQCHFAWQAQYLRLLALAPPCSALTLRALHFTLYITLHFTLYTFHFTIYTLHSTPYTSHFTLHTLHSTFYTYFRL